MHEDSPAPGISRRQVLQRGGGALLGTTALGALLSACGDGDGGTATTGGGAAAEKLSRPLRMHHDAALGPAFEPYVKHFNSVYAPVRLSTSYVTQDYVGTTQAQLAGGSVDYDVLFVDEGYAQKWYDAGWIRSLEDVDALKDVPDQFQPGVVDSLRATDGTLMAMPYYRRVELFILNRDHLSRIGAEPAATWDEFVAQCRELKAKGIVDTPYSPFWNQEFSMIWYTLAAEAISDGAGPLFADDGTPQFQDDDAVHRTIARWQRLYEEGLVPKDSFTTSYANTANVFAGGKSSFTIRYSLQLKGFRDPRQSKVADAATNALMPGSRRASLSGMAYWVMAKSTPAPQTAGELVRYLANKEKGGDYYVPKKLIATDLSLQTPYAAVNGDPQVQRSWAAFADAKALGQQIENSVGLGPAVNQGWYGGFLEAASGQIQDAVRGKTSTQDALAAAADYATSRQS